VDHRDKPGDDGFIVIATKAWRKFWIAPLFARNDDH
jgi:hypothetical protein